MINTTELTKKQEDYIRAARTFFGKKTVVSRTELVNFMNTTFQRKYSPGFITKNEAFKFVDPKTGEVIRGKYNLAVAKVPTKALSMTKDAIRKRELAASKKSGDPSPVKPVAKKRAVAKKETVATPDPSPGVTDIDPTVDASGATA